MFEPNYKNIVNSARNIEAERLPLYEHNVDFGKIGEIMGVDLPSLYKGDEKDIHEFFRVYSKFFKDYGYDVVTFECCIGGNHAGKRRARRQPRYACDPGRRGF